MRGKLSDFGPIPWAAEDGLRRPRIGISRLPWWRRSWIGLLPVALIVLPWLPICGPPSDAAPARRVRGVGDAPILTFAFAPHGGTIATLQMNGRAALRDAAAGASAPAFLDYRGFALALAFSPDGRMLAVSGSEPDILLYDLRAGGAGRPLGMPIRDGKGLALSPDGRTLAVSSYLDHDVLLWDLAAGRERARLRGHQSAAISLAFAPDGRTLASGAMSDRAILLWDLATGRPLRRLGVPAGPVPCLAYSPDGPWLASVRTHERQVRLWDLEGRRGDRLIGSHSRARESVAFSPDGRMLATAGEDWVVRLWDLATDTELRRVGGSDDPLTAVAFSPDGRILAAAGRDADIRLWNVADLFGGAIRRDPSPDSSRQEAGAAFGRDPSRAASISDRSGRRRKPSRSLTIAAHRIGPLSESQGPPSATRTVFSQGGTVVSRRGAPSSADRAHLSRRPPTSVASCPQALPGHEADPEIEGSLTLSPNVRRGGSGINACARRSDDTDARKEARRCFGRSDRCAHSEALTRKSSSPLGESAATKSLIATCVQRTCS
jgi:WD40 repeat protein